MRILVSAYGCEPGKGSEPGVGWNWVLQLARFCELVVITRANNQGAIEAALPVALRDRVRFVYHDASPWVQRIKRGDRGLYPYYLVWQWGAYQRARDLVRQERFDWVMALTFGSIWMPTFMHRLPVPMIWGPIGGGEAVPFRLIPALPWRDRIVQYLRYALMSTLRFNPMVMGTVRRARWVLARTGDTARLIPSEHTHKVRTVLETGIAEEWLRVDIAQRCFETVGRPLRAIYTGRLVAWKNVAVAIAAVAHARRLGADVELVVVGQGPDRDRLQAMAGHLGVSGAVRFTGSMAQTALFEELRAADMYLFPSLREGGVWSLMEAMATGLPVVCLNASGMAIITDDTCALRVPPGTPDEVRQGFGDALWRLCGSSALRAELGRRGRERIETHFRWSAKGDAMQRLLAGQRDAEP